MTRPNLIGFAFSLFGMAGSAFYGYTARGLQVDRSRVADNRQVEDVLKVAKTWEGIAMQWKSNSDRFEAVAREFQRQAMQKADDFAVCNSMLPVEKRM